MIKLSEGLDSVKAFLDGTDVLGRAVFEYYIEELDEVLTRVEESGLRINIAKSEWSVKQVKYLGHIVSTDGRSLDPKKMQGLIEMKSRRQKGK